MRAWHVSFPVVRLSFRETVLRQKSRLAITVLETCLWLFKFARLSQSDSHKVWLSEMMKKPTKAELGGMTVNERLFAMGLLDKWDAAAKARDRDRMIQILSQCALSQEQCAETTDAVLKNPAMYGF